MRIPTSMIVMGVLTAIPFGLAIRQTAHKSTAADRELEESLDPSLKYERQYEADRRQQAARLAELQAEEAHKQAETRRKQEAVFGATPATLGTLFQGMALGASSETFQPEAARARIVEARDYDIEVEFELDLKAFVGVKVTVGPSYRRKCDQFKGDLVAAWGEGEFDDSGRLGWAANGQRGVFDPHNCTLWIEQFSPIAAWIGHGDKIVPVDYLGKPGKALIDKLGPTVDADDQSISWQAIGVGTGTSTGTTTLTAELANGKIVAITANTDADNPTRNQVIEQMVKVFGPSKPSESGEADTWARPPIELRDSYRGIELRIGK